MPTDQFKQLFDPDLSKVSAKERGGLAAAQNFESLEGGALAQRMLVAARQHRVGQRLGCYLAGALS